MPDPHPEADADDAAAARLLDPLRGDTAEPLDHLLGVLLAGTPAGRLFDGAPVPVPPGLVDGTAGPAQIAAARRGARSAFRAAATAPARDRALLLYLVCVAAGVVHHGDPGSAVPPAELAGWLHAAADAAATSGGPVAGLLRRAAASSAA